MQDKLNLGEPKGEMDFSAQYRFDYKDNIAGLILKESKLKLNKISLAEKGKKDPMLAISAVEANNISFDLIARELIIPDFNIRKGNISASVNEKGTINWQNIITSHNFSEKDTAKDNAPKSDGDPWTIKVNGLAIEDVAVNYTDYSRAKPLAANAIVSNVLLNLSAKVGKGLINAILDGLKAKLSNVLLSEAGNDNPVISLNTIELNDGQIDVGLGTVKLTGLGAAGGKTNLLRNKDGHLQLLELLVPGKKAKTNSQVAEIDSQARAESKPWSYSLDKFELKDYHVTLQDQTLSPAVSYDLQDIRVLLTNIANKSEKPIDFETALNVKQGGNLTISGQVSQSADYADVNARIKDISLEPLRPLLNKFTYLELESGKISTSAVLHYRSSKSGPKINAEGFLNVNKFRLNETETGKRFIEWKDLAANKIKLGISPDKLQIKDVKLIKPGARIIVFKDRSVNLARILKSPDKSAMKTAAQSKPFSSASSDEKNKDFPISIERIRIEKGVVDFADLSLVLPFPHGLPILKEKLLKYAQILQSKPNLSLMVK
jgi:hypothetical protein